MWYDRQGKLLTTAPSLSPEWEKQMREVEKLLTDKDYKIVKQEYTKNKKYWISTVWLGLDHSWANGSVPIIFETMAFNAKPNKEGHRDSHDQTRYATEEEALKGHKKMLAKYNRKDK